MAMLELSVMSNELEIRAQEWLDNNEFLKNDPGVIGFIEGRPENLKYLYSLRDDNQAVAMMVSVLGMPNNGVAQDLNKMSVRIDSFKDNADLFELLDTNIPGINNTNFSIGSANVSAQSMLPATGNYASDAVAAFALIAAGYKALKNLGRYMLGNAVEVNSRAVDKDNDYYYTQEGSDYRDFDFIGSLTPGTHDNRGFNTPNNRRLSKSGLPASTKKSADAEIAAQVTPPGKTRSGVPYQKGYSR
jgi:hypothetical protein